MTSKREERTVLYHKPPGDPVRDCAVGTGSSVDPAIVAIEASLLRAPIVLGETHPAEMVLGAVLSGLPDRELADREVVYLLASRALASVVRLLARCGAGGQTVRIAIEHALAAPDHQTRDAAIDAAEETASGDLAGLLRAHAAIEGDAVLALSASRVADALTAGGRS